MARNRYFEDEKVESINSNNFRRLLKYLKPYRLQIIISLLLMAVASFANLMGPYLTKIAIDDYIVQGDTQGLLTIALIFLGLMLVNMVCVRFRVLIMNKAGQKIIRNLRKSLFEHIQKLSFGFFDSRPAGKIIVRLMNNVNSLQDLLENGLINIITNIFTLVTILIIMFNLHVRLTFVTLSVLPILAVAVFIVKKKIGFRWRQVQRKDSNMNAYLHESLTGMKITQAYVREEKNSGIFNTLLDEHRVSWLRAIGLSHGVFPIVLVINTVSVMLVYWFGIGYLNEGLVTIGTLIAFLQYVWRVWEPIINMSNFYNQVLVANSALERIFGVMDTEPEIYDLPEAQPLPQINGKVEFKDVNFAYEKDQKILTDMSFVVQPGQTIAIVGPTGAGKSTIINLITRFYDIDQGQILIDDINIKNVTIDSLRSRVGVMMQDTFIFSGTIIDNIRYGDLEASKEEVVAAAKAVYAHDFIMEMEEGYETEVKERGSRMSVGQRQLIAFARTILSNPGILILDEATSSIDTRTEMLVQKATDAVLEGRTSFVIAHRLSTIRNADRIMVLEEGQIVEEGNHEELLKQRGSYYDLYRAQYERVSS